MYNSAISSLDQMADYLRHLEQELRGYSEKMLMGVGARYGKDSLEYMQSGGTLRKSSSRRADTAPTESPAPTLVVEAWSLDQAPTNGSGTKVAVK
jgi:hypothetical protein